MKTFLAASFPLALSLPGFLPEDSLWLSPAVLRGLESEPPGRSLMCVDMTSRSMDEHTEAGGGQGQTALLRSPRGGSTDVQAHVQGMKKEKLWDL